MKDTRQHLKNMLNALVMDDIEQARISFKLYSLAKIRQKLYDFIMEDRKEKRD